MSVKIIGIGGAPGLGQKYVAKVLAEYYTGTKCLNFSLDDYYVDRRSRAVPRNPSHPKNINVSELLKTLKALKESEEELIVIVTGPFALYFDKLVELFDTEIFVKEEIDDTSLIGQLYDKYIRYGVCWAHATVDYVDGQVPDLKRVFEHLAVKPVDESLVQIPVISKFQYPQSCFDESDRNENVSSHSAWSYYESLSMRPTSAEDQDSGSYTDEGNGCFCFFKRCQRRKPALDESSISNVSHPSSSSSFSFTLS